MTKLESLQKLLLVWQWLDEHPGARKVEAYDTLRLDYDESYCPACEHDERERGDAAGCTHCPIWPTRRVKHCSDPGSEYGEWRDGYGAGAMLDIIRQRLQECQS